MHAHLLHMPITQCNFHPFTFYLPFHTSSPVDQCPIYAPSNCTMGLDTCARHSLFGRTDPYYTVILYSSCSHNKHRATTLAFLLSVSALSSQYLFQRGPIWMRSIVPSATTLNYFPLLSSLLSPSLGYSLGLNCTDHLRVLHVLLDTSRNSLPVMPRQWGITCKAAMLYFIIRVFITYSSLSLQSHNYKLNMFDEKLLSALIRKVKRFS